jgi:hypothetical protein
MKQMDGLKNFGSELYIRTKLFELEASKIHPAGKKAVEFCNNYINLNKALFGAEFFEKKIDPTKDYTVTIVCEIFPVVYIHLLSKVFNKNTKFYVITKQYTAHLLQPLFWKHFPNVELVNKHPMFDTEIEWHFDQSDCVFIPDSDYLMPFNLLDHFKFKNALVLNFKDPHERKTNNNLVFDEDELLDMCDMSESHEHATYKVPPSGSSFFGNNRLFFVYGNRLYGK